jgi:hypothetical protein
LFIDLFALHISRESLGEKVHKNGRMGSGNKSKSHQESFVGFMCFAFGFRVDLDNGI